MESEISTRAGCTSLCDKVCQWLATVRWFSQSPPVSSTNKTDRQNKTEILLKVALNTIKHKQYLKLWSVIEKFEDTTGFSWLQRHLKYLFFQCWDIELLNECYSRNLSYTIHKTSTFSIQNLPVNTFDITTKYPIWSFFCNALHYSIFIILLNPITF